MPFKVFGFLGLPGHETNEAKAYGLKQIEKGSKKGREEGEREKREKQKKLHKVVSVTFRPRTNDK